jgi:hypothetical protein
MEETFLRVRVPEVTFEDFHNEVLIIDLKTGHYHSLCGSAASIWRLLSTGHSLEGCVAWMKDFYPAAPPTLESDTTRFVTELETAGLIARVSEPGPGSEIAFEDLSTEYHEPTINSYGDLQDLLLLDPIHEIAPEAGWPQRREEA